ncbi:MAG: hypothetical protein IJQ90_03575 [Alphaproteobacteria bacterium]|nr:hypothetical protein [Alphaproteobacteria bacterium]
MPENNVRDNNARRTTDDNLIALAKNIARAYREIGILTEREYNVVRRTNNLDAINDIIGDIPNMESEQKLQFCKSFVADDTENFNGATPAILAYAYMATRNENTPMARALAARIDDMSADFANSGGMVLETGTKWPLVDITNIADVYEGFSDALNARIADLDAGADAEKIAQMKSNLAQMETVIADYDRAWGLDKVHDTEALEYGKRWDKLNDALNRAGLFAATKDAVKKYNFTDEHGDVIPQILENGELDQEGRAAAILDLARGDIARRRISTANKKLDANEIEQELNDEFLFKLYETANADKIVKMAQENPEVFTDQQRRNDFVREMMSQGGDISNTAYNAALDSNANAVAGWAPRLKAKLGTAADNVGGLWNKIFNKNHDVDRLNNVRIAPQTIDKRQKRIELFKRVLKGFASGFVASMIITTIATAAAATAGISMAASMAAIGIVTAIGMGVVQVNRWRRRQQDAGLPTDIHAFLADKRLVTSLGVSAIAVVAMCFGAGGMADAAMALGYGALAAGGAKNAIESYRDARDSRMSVAESVAWAIANAGAVVAGGLTGRYTANAAINAYNNANPENTIFQNQETRTIEHTNTTTETRTEYTQDALDNAEKIARMWYRDNPDILQQRVDAINAYNAEHGTSIDPYRAIMINGDAGGQTFDNMRLHVNNSHLDANINDVYSHGHHRVLTDAWGRAHGFTGEELNAAARLFNADGSVNANGMDVVSRLDGVVSETNTVGAVPGRPVQTDGYFKPNDPEGWTTYTDGRPATVENIYDTTETTYENLTDYTRARGDGMAAFGNYNPRERKTTLRDRIGAFWDKINQDKKENPVIEPVLTDEPKDESRDDNPFIPVVSFVNDKDKDKAETPVIEPVLTDEPKDEKVDFDDVFPGPGDVVDTETVYTLDPENTPVIEPVIENVEQPVAPVADDKILAITRSQAKSWHDLHARLEKNQKKLSKSPHGSKADKLHAEESKLQYLINKLRNELGHYDDDTIERAAREALLREDLNAKQALVAAGPGAGATKWDELDWRGEIAKLDHKINKKIEQWGDDIESGARADKSKLRFPTPVPGVQRQKKDARGYVKLPTENELHPRADEIVVEPRNEKPIQVKDAEPKPTRAERRAARREQKMEQKAKRRAEHERIAASLPQKVERFNLFGALKRALGKVSKNDKPEREYFVPESLEQLVYDANLIAEPITTIRGVPVRLIDLGGNDNPITQNYERPIVVVEIKQNVVRDGMPQTDLVRVPFYLATGTEYHSYRPTGHWYPLSMLRSDKSTRIEQDYNAPELEHIAKALDKKIGDVRNWRDNTLTQKRESAGRVGFVGGADAMQHVNPELVNKIVAESVCGTRSLYNYSPEYVAVARDWMLDALADIESPDWAERKRKFGGGIKNIAHRALNRFGFGRDDYEDDEYEH